MEINKQTLLKILSVLDEKNVLPYITLIGSWAEFLYSETKVLSNFNSIEETTDMDFLIHHEKEPKDRISIIENMKKNRL